MSTLLIGNELTTEPHKGVHSVKKQAGWLFKAIATGTMEEIALRTDSEANTGITSLYLGIFAASGGKPGNLLGSAKYTGSYPVASSAWVAVTGLNVSIIDETEYYFGICASAGGGIHLAFEHAAGEGTQLWETGAIYEKLETVEAAKWITEGKLGPNRMYGKGTVLSGSLGVFNSPTSISPKKLYKPFPTSQEQKIKQEQKLLSMII
jgi:hypothetical protein